MAALLLMSGLTWAQTDVLDHDVIGVSGNSYSSWTGLTLTSGAVYAGNTAGGNNAIQMRSNNNNSGIITTASGGVVTNITVVWNENTTAGRTLNVYGKNAAYSAASDLYGNNAGTLIGTIAKGTTDLEITDDYAFIGIRSASGALYLDEIQITWVSGGTPNPSITAGNVEIAYDATDGAIEYTINNGVEGGVLTAATEAEWLTLDTVGSTVPFTCSVNPDGERTATVTLTYTYNTDQTVTKNVTVTQTTNPNAPGTEANPYTVAQARAAIDAGVGTQEVYATGIVSAIPTAYNSTYGNVTFNMVDEEGDEEFLQAYRCGGDEAANVAIGDVVVVYGNLTYHSASGTYEFGQGCQVISLTHPVITDPTITIATYTLNVDAEAHEGTINVTYANVDTDMAEVMLCNAEGQPATYDWIQSTLDDNHNIGYNISANEGEARTAYLKVCIYETYPDVISFSSDIVTINQTEYVAPVLDYAELPFAFNSGRAAIEETEGLSQEGLGSDYGTENTKLKFDGTGDWLLLQFNERPGTLTFDIKGNSFSGSTFTVQTSEDGTTYTDLATYTDTELTSTVLNEEFTDLGENVRYIKWIYTEKSGGNVGLGNIALAEYSSPVLVPSITFDPDFLNFDSELHYDGALPFTYENIIVENPQSFGLQFYTVEGEETEMPEWFFAMVTPQSNENNGEYQVSCAIMANEGEARSVYFKVYAFDADSIPVYSNLATVNQAAPVFDYAVLPFVWEGGSSADFAALNGVTLSGNGSDYNSNHSPYLIKFDGTGDYIQVKTDSQPGTVTIGVKMIGGGNTSTITIQGSADGETFTDIEELTISGAQNDTLTLETTNAFDANDRYVRMLFTKGSNVGVGPITIAKGTAPSITLTPDTFDLEAVGPLNGNHLPSMMVSYNNFEIAQASDFNYQFYNAEGEEQEMPEWIPYSEVSLITETSYQAICIVTANDGPARSAYFKLYAFDADSIPVYSNLVTINQAGVHQQYTLTVEPFENLELITFVNDEMVMEGDGEITVTEGDQVMLSVVAMESYVMETLMVNGVNHVNDIADDFTYTFEMPAENVTISATAVEDVPPTPGEWVMVSLNDLTENDVFVIVGVYDVDESSFAMANNSTNAPSAVAVTMVGNTLSGDIAENLKWNLSIGEDGYTFYPNGETESWLYCNNSNNGVRVGTNENNVFTMTPEGYLYNNATSRYIGIYNRQDWRCYTSINNNIKDQTFAFYKRVDEGSLVTYTLDIEGYGDSDGGYYLIASPVSMIRPTAENGFLTETYDLYYFDQAQEGEEWRNYEAKHFNIVSGKGYLYASQENTTLTFTGVPYNGNGEIVLDQAGWNLIGNPHNTSATVNRDFYRLNADGSELELSETSEVNKMQGIFVEAQNENEVVLFDAGMGTFGDTEMKLNLRVNGNNGSSDFARIRFGEGSTLGKFMFNANNTKLYFTQDSEEFAVVRSSNENEMPVNFKAATNGIYTFSVNAENMEVDYLHLIDNMTGADIDLLDTPSYSFEANTSDYAQRFRLVFATTTGINESADTFAYFNGSEWVISNMGKATLQVVDMTGRILSNETISGSTTISTDNLSAGIYMMRLVNGNNVKVQKVVVR